ncbi:MAG: hypothetical protein LBR05_06885 [Azoarcus sp.]|nr:hypothetical protein [Azoarcus sp.]
MTTLPQWAEWVLTLILFGVFFALTISLPEAEIAHQPGQLLAAAKINLIHELEWMSGFALPFIYLFCAAMAIVSRLILNERAPSE